MGSSFETWAVLIARGDGSERVEGAMVDIGLVLEPVETVDGAENVFERCGYFEQYYWSTDDYIIFSKGKMEANNIVLV